MISKEVSFMDDKVKKTAAALVEKVKEVVKKGNVTKIQVTRKGEVVVSFPATVGVVAGVAAAPWALLLAAVTTLGLDCGIEVIKEDGSVIHIA